MSIVIIDNDSVSDGNDDDDDDDDDGDCSDVDNSRYPVRMTSYSGSVTGYFKMKIIRSFHF